jgi:hypothetical protein
MCIKEHEEQDITKKMLCCREMFGRNALRRHVRMEN